MDNTRTVSDAKRRKAQYNREYKIRVKNEIDNSGGREERLARAAAYRKRYREKKKEEQFNSLRQIDITDGQCNTSTSIFTITSTSSDVAPSKVEEQRARRAECNRKYRAKKKEERLNKLRGITTATHQHSDTPSTSTSNAISTTSIPVATTTNDPIAITMDAGTNHQVTCMTNNNNNLDRRVRSVNFIEIWDRAKVRFNETFMKIRFDRSCSVCDRLWTDSSLKEAPLQSYDILRQEFPGKDVSTFQVCKLLRYACEKENTEHEFE
jgi:hypothetical protein